jgi:hypothetical protein
MAEETNVERVVEDIKELTQEEKELAWEKWVRSEVNAALDIYLPSAVNGHINIKYSPLEVERLESGPVYDENRVTGVLLSILFDFENPIEIKKLEPVKN